MTYQMSESIASLAASLAKAQGELQAASMNADNPFFKSKYADLGSVWDACRSALSTNGLSIIQNPSVSENGDRVDLTTILAHSSGEWISSTVSAYVGNNQKLSHAQAIGSIITYLRRYSLASMVGVYADEDTDGNQEGQRQPRPKATQQPEQRPAQQQNVAHAPNGNNPITHKEQAVKDKTTFVAMFARESGWTEQEVKDAAKALGMVGISGEAEVRQKQWDTLCEWRTLKTDEQMPDSLALAVINGQINIDEARLSMGIAN